jgi:ribose transport system substrate-binding protein
MRKRTIKALFLAVLPIIVLLTSCERKFHQPDERYVFVAANIDLPYWQEAKSGFLEASRVLGVKAEFTGPTTYSPEQQLDAFRKAVASHPSGILVSPTRPDIFKDPIDAALQAGIPVICVDSDAPESRRILFVGTDNYRAGISSGERMASLLHEHGLVAVISIPGQQNLDERLRGVQEAFKRYPRIGITQVLDDRGDPRAAKDQVTSFLAAGQRIDGIVCLEASGGAGAAEALQARGLGGKIVIVAMDKNPATLDWISNHGIAATITQKPFTMSFYGMKFLDDLHHNVVHEFNDWRTAPTSPLPALVDTGTVLVDSNNLVAFLAEEAARPKAR